MEVGGAGEGEEVGLGRGKSWVSCKDVFVVQAPSFWRCLLPCMVFLSSSSPSPFFLPSLLPLLPSSPSPLPPLLSLLPSSPFSPPLPSPLLSLLSSSPFSPPLPSPLLSPLPSSPFSPPSLLSLLLSSSPFSYLCHAPSHPRVTTTNIVSKTTSLCIIHSCTHEGAGHM